MYLQKNVNFREKTIGVGRDAEPTNNSIGPFGPQQQLKYMITSIYLFSTFFCFIVFLGKGCPDSRYLLTYLLLKLDINRSKKITDFF